MASLGCSTFRFFEKTMQRLFFCVIAFCLVHVSSLTIAEDEPLLTVNAESSAMIEQYRKELDGLETSEAKAAALGKLLQFQLRFIDKVAVKETVKALLTLADGIENDAMRTRFLSVVSFTQSELGDYDGASKTAEMILTAQDRAETQLNLAEKFLDEQEEKKSDKPFDVIALLRKAVNGAAEAKDLGLEALALAVLGGELLKVNSIDEAKAAFQQSREKAAELEEIEERSVIGLIVRNNVRNSQTDEAIALVDSVQTDEMKAVLTGIIARTEASEGRLDAARKTVDSMKPGDVRDNVLAELGRQAAKTESATALLELSKAISTPERIEAFQQLLLEILVQEKRLDVAGEIVKASANPEECELTLSVHQLESLIDAGKFDDAEKLTETFTEPRLKAGAIHHLVRACVQAGEIDKAAQLLEDSRTEDEAATLAELAALVAAVADGTDRETLTETLFEILQAQLQLLDVKGAGKTLDVIVDSIRQVDDSARRVAYLLFLSRVSSELDKSRAVPILDELFTFLTGINDPMELKELVSREQHDPTQPILELDSSIDESTVKEQFFILYVNIAGIASKIGNSEKAKKSLAKATEMLAAEPELGVKLQKMLLIAQIYAEIE